MEDLKLPAPVQLTTSILASTIGTGIGLEVTNEHSVASLFEKIDFALGKPFPIRLFTTFLKIEVIEGSLKCDPLTFDLLVKHANTIDVLYALALLNIIIENYNVTTMQRLKGDKQKFIADCAKLAYEHVKQAFFDAANVQKDSKQIQPIHIGIFGLSENLLKSEAIRKISAIGGDIDHATLVADVGSNAIKWALKSSV